MIGPEFLNSILQETEMKLRVVVEDGRKGVLTQQTVKKITSVKNSKNIKNILTRGVLLELRLKWCMSVDLDLR